MFVPFALIGIGEIMVNPTCYYYSYVLTPKKTRSVIQAVNLVFQGALPTALVSVGTTILAGATKNNLNDGHTEFLYYVAVVVLIIGSIIFFVVDKLANIEKPTEAFEEPVPDGASFSFHGPIHEARGESNAATTSASLL